MRRVVFIALVVATALLGAAIARAELTKDGGLLVAFSGRILPHSLPRDRDAPVRVSLDGRVRTTDGSKPPQLRRLSIAVNRYGRLSTEGLPTCRPEELESTSPGLAMARCGDALVGHGRFGAHLEFPEAPPFPAEGTMLAFNGRSHGRQAIFLHIHGSRPVEITVILTFQIHHLREGKFGTVFTAKIPRIAADLGYVTDVSLDFSRRYRYRGQPRSFLSARCAAPDGFPGALFSFARGTFFFADGKRLTSTLARDCLVR
jgi:hypothetical protein